MQSAKRLSLFSSLRIPLMTKGKGSPSRVPDSVLVIGGHTPLHTAKLSPLRINRGQRRALRPNRVIVLAGLLTCGSKPSRAFPSRAGTVAYADKALRLQLRGQSRIGHKGRTPFPSIRIESHPDRKARKLADRRANCQFLTIGFLHQLPETRTAPFFAPALNAQKGMLRRSCSENGGMKPDPGSPWKRCQAVRKGGARRSVLRFGRSRSLFCRHGCGLCRSPRPRLAGHLRDMNLGFGTVSFPHSASCPAARVSVRRLAAICRL